MMPWILVGAGLVLAWLLFGQRKRFTKGKPPTRLETWIVIEGTPAHPTVKDPDPLCGHRGDRLLWHIDNRTGGPVEVWLPDFKLKANPSVKDPLAGPNHARKNQPNPDEIRDVIKPQPEAGVYKYDIWVNGAKRLDPDLEIII
jgi:hypothetical protein